MNTCFAKLESLHRPGGESTKDSLIAPFKSLKTNLTANSTFQTLGLLSGEVIGLDLGSDQVFFSDCFEKDCMSGGGLYTTAVESTISQTVNNITSYWIPATETADGSYWFVDLGVICPATGAISILDSQVPIGRNGTFTSRVSLPVGIKVAVLKQVTANSLEVVEHTFGSYLNPDLLTRSKPASNLQYNAVDQAIDLEETGLALTSLLCTRYQDQQEGELTYYLTGELDQKLEFIIHSNFKRLSRLVDNTSVTKRVGSIPKTLTTYLEPENLYGDIAEAHYQNRIVRLFEPDCFESDCFEVVPNTLLAKREVSTRAIAWLTYALTLYTYNYNSEFQPLLNSLTTYLLNQIEPSLFLAQEGWTDSIPLSSSQPILTYNLSTSVITAVALLKLYEYQNNEVLIEAVANLYEGILEHLYLPNQQVFVQQLNSKETSTKSTIYSLLFASLFNRVDLVEPLLKNLLLRPDFNTLKFPYVIDNNGDLISDGNNNYVYSTYDPLSKEAIDANFFNLLITKPYAADLNELIPILGNSLLMTQVLSLLKARNYEINPIFKTLKESLFKVLKTERYIGSFFGAASCLDESQTLCFALPYQEVNQLIFQRALVYQKLKAMWPLEYSWASKLGLSPQGNLGKLLLMFSKSLATFYVSLTHLAKASQLQQSLYSGLKQWGNDLNTSRFKNESNELYSTRLQKTLTKVQTITKAGILEALRELSVPAFIKEPWQLIQSSSTPNASPFSTKVGEAFYSGENYATSNLIEVEVQQPLEEPIETAVLNNIAAGIKVIFKESLSLELSFELANPTICVQVTETFEEFCNLTLENTGKLFIEDESGRLAVCTPLELSAEACTLVDEQDDYLVGDLTDGSIEIVYVCSDPT